MCKFKLFTIAAAALMMAACSSEDITQQPKTGEMQFTATIAAPSNGGTRTAYTVDGTDIKVAWKVGDEIALVHNYVKDVATVKSVDATTGQATISGIITGTPADGDAVKLIYPAAYISGVNNDGFPTMDEGYYNLLFAQDGTLDYIQNNIDFRHNDNGQLSVTETGVTLKSTVIMESSMAIWKLTLQDNAATPAALAATKVTIKSGGNDLASTAVLTTGKSTLYLAVPADGTSANICITAATADNDYFYMKEGVALEAKKYYQSTVQMTKGAILSLVTAETYIAKDGETLTGALAADATTKIKIANNATVTLKDVTINGTNVDDIAHKHAGITCDGDATIKLEGTNMVKGFYEKSPGISVPDGKTLTIQGTGSLTASSNGKAAGIGSGYQDFCGAITISGGTITATGGLGSAGIGSGYQGTCGAITISGGTVTAMGGDIGAGIGSGYQGSYGTIEISGGIVTATGGQWAAGIGGGFMNKTCGTITITSGVTSVTATKGSSATNSIGAGNGGTAITVSIAAGANVIATGHALSASAVGEIVGSDGKAYAVADKNYLPSGVTAVAMIAYVSGSNGLAIALADESGSMNWSTAKSTCEAKTPAFTGGTWKLPSLDEWKNMLTYDGGFYMNNNLQTALSTAGGNSLQEWMYYWSSTDYVSDNTQACDVKFQSGEANFSNESKTYTSGMLVRAVLAF